jgi:AcrR family transcriptional regulator
VAKNERVLKAGPVRIRITTSTDDPPKERLTRERIVEAALTLMAEQGYEAVSMRTVARALDTGPASLYAHVANKEELDQLVIDELARGVEIPEPDPERWTEQIKELGRAILHAYRMHPGSARAGMGIIPTGEGTGGFAEGVMAICLAGGISPQAAAWFVDLFAAYTSVIAYEESLWLQRSGGTPSDLEAHHAELDEGLAEFFGSLPADRFPSLVRYAVELTKGDGDDRFEFGMDVLVAGLAAVSHRYA